MFFNYEIVELFPVKLCFPFRSMLNLYDEFADGKVTTDCAKKGGF